MRGAERPGEVKWHRPFISPLEPLSDSASRQIFLEVADDPGAGEESALRHLLDLSGSLPLAVSLIASIASFEGYPGTLSRWQIENVALLSDGPDKRSNLEKSIILSLSSPRLSSSLHAKNLLVLLSLLPDGIRAEDHGKPRPDPQYPTIADIVTAHFAGAHRYKRAPQSIEPHSRIHPTHPSALTTHFPAPS